MGAVVVADVTVIEMDRAVADVTAVHVIAANFVPAVSVGSICTEAGATIAATPCFGRVRLAFVGVVAGSPVTVVERVPELLSVTVGLDPPVTDATPENSTPVGCGAVESVITGVGPVWVEKAMLAVPPAITDVGAVSTALTRIGVFGLAPPETFVEGHEYTRLRFCGAAFAAA